MRSHFDSRRYQATMRLCQLLTKHRKLKLDNLLLSLTRLTDLSIPFAPIVVLEGDAYDVCNEVVFLVGEENVLMALDSFSDVS